MLPGLSRGCSIAEQRQDGPDTDAVHRRAGTAFPDALSQARRHPKPSRAWPGNAGWACRDVRKTGPAIPTAVTGERERRWPGMY